MPLPATTRMFEIKLSGIEGLVPRFFGDIDKTTATPNLRVANQENQDATSGSNRMLAGGIYNPFRRYGYLSAANNTFAVIQGASSNTFSSMSNTSILDGLNKSFYLGTLAGDIWYGSGLDSTNLAQQTTDLSGSVTMTDMEIYQVNGVRKLFYSFYWKQDTVASVSTGADTISVTNAYVANGTAVTFTVIGGGLPAPLVAGTTYLTAGSTGLTFTLTDTSGTPINITTTGSGTITINGAFGGIGIATLPYASQNAQWGTKTVSGAFNLGSNFHVMVPDASFLYVLDGPSVHRIDGNAQTGGTNGTIVPNVFYFPPYYNFVDGVDYRGNLFIAVHNHSTKIRGVDDVGETQHPYCGVVVWNKSDTIASQADLVPVPALKEIRKIYVSPSGFVRLIGVTSENITIILEYDGSKFNHVVEVGYLAYPQYVDSFANGSFFVTWLGADGNIYAHGYAQPNEKVEGLFIIGNIGVSPNQAGTGSVLFGGANSGSGTAGFKAYRTGLVLAYNFSGGSVVRQWDIYGTGKSGVTSVQHVGNIFTPVYYLTEVLGYTHYPSQLANLNYIEFYFQPVTSVVSANCFTIDLYYNQSTTSGGTFIVSSVDATRGYYRCEVNKQYINSVQIGIKFSAALNLESGNDVGISTAILVYEPTNTKG